MYNYLEYQLRNRRTKGPLYFYFRHLECELNNNKTVILVVYNRDIGVSFFFNIKVKTDQTRTVLLLLSFCIFLVVFDSQSRIISVNRIEKKNTLGK